MNEALILEKLESLSNEIQELKAEIRQVREPPISQPEPAAAPAKTFEELSAMVEDIHSSMAEMREVNSTLRSGLELTSDLEPIAKQVFPKAISYLDEIDDQFDPDELKVLITKTLTSLEAMNEAFDMMKSGMELKEDLNAIVKQSYPRAIKFLSALHEGEFQAEQLGDLLHNILLNIHTFSDLMNMISPMTEFIKEFEVAMRQTDVLSNMNKWLDSLQQSNGAIKFMGMTMAAFKRIDLSDEQFDRMCDSLSTINLCQVEPVGPVAMMKQLRDPKFQEAMGAMFMVMQALGGCIQACHNNPGRQKL